MSRRERRVLAAEMRKLASAYPEHLEPVDALDWPARREGQTEYPYAVWRSRRYLVQVYEARELFAGDYVSRVSVNRVTMGTGGRWDEALTWDELQAIKSEIGFGDRYAVEVYPRERDVVNVANMRHLWILANPLTIGWFAEAAE